MKTSTITKLKKVGLNPKEFTTESPQSLIGKTVVGDPKIFGNIKEKLLFEVTGGFGAELGLSGTALFVTRLSDGLKFRIERYEIIASKI